MYITQIHQSAGLNCFVLKWLIGVSNLLQLFCEFNGIYPLPEKKKFKRPKCPTWPLFQNDCRDWNNIYNTLPAQAFMHIFRQQYLPGSHIYSYVKFKFYTTFFTVIYSISFALLDYFIFHGEKLSIAIQHFFLIPLTVPLYGCFKILLTRQPPLA